MGGTTTTIYEPFLKDYGTKIPYLSHLFSGLVLIDINKMEEDGGEFEIMCKAISRGNMDFSKLILATYGVPKECCERGTNKEIATALFKLARQNNLLGILKMRFNTEDKEDATGMDILDFIAEVIQLNLYEGLYISNYKEVLTRRILNLLKRLVHNSGTKKYARMYGAVAGGASLVMGGKPQDMESLFMGDGDVEDAGGRVSKFEKQRKAIFGEKWCDVGCILEKINSPSFPCSIIDSLFTKEERSKYNII